MNLAEFMRRHGAELLAQAHGSFPPLVRSGEVRTYGRRPMGAQALLVAGAVRALREGEKGVFLVGEMGTGKTFMGILTALNLHPEGRFLVLCPPHLVAKWAREVAMEGAKAVVLERAKDVAALLGEKGPLFAVVSRERAKLGPGWEPALLSRRSKGGLLLPACPSCFRPLSEQDAEKAARVRLKCPACGSPLWREAPPRRESVYHALKRLLPKGFFRLVILDEVHEYKGSGTAQALVAAGLLDWVGQGLLLTGTLFGGYASGLYHLLKRSVPEIRERYPRESDFVAAYGLLERVYVEREEVYGRYTRRKEGRSSTRERPGLSPLLLAHLLPRAGFVRLGEVAEGLPPYGEEVVLLDMDPEHGERYEAFAREVRDLAAQALARGSKRLLGALVQAGIQVPDSPWREEVLVAEEGTARFHPLPGAYRHAKERKLLELVREERARGRRVLVYVQATGERDQVDRLVDLLREGGLRAKGLRADTVAPERREAWIAEAVREGLDALVVHPRLVQTGLDLVDFPTVVFYQPEYSVYTLRQAARRSWRIGQKRPVRVVFLAYRGTLQEAALALIAKKARASLALEGELVEGGLVSAAEEDPTLALAKALAGAQDLTWREEGVALEGGAIPKREVGRWRPRAPVPS